MSQLGASSIRTILHAKCNAQTRLTMAILCVSVLYYLKTLETVLNKSILSLLPYLRPQQFCRSLCPFFLLAHAYVSHECLHLVPIHKMLERRIT